MKRSVERQMNRIGALACIIFMDDGAVIGHCIACCPPACKTSTIEFYQFIELFQLDLDQNNSPTMASDGLTRRFNSYTSDA